METKSGCTRLVAAPFNERRLSHDTLEQLLSSCGGRIFIGNITGEAIQHKTVGEGTLLETKHNFGLFLMNVVFLVIRDRCGKKNGSIFRLVVIDFS